MGNINIEEIKNIYSRLFAERIEITKNEKKLRRQIREIKKEIIDYNDTKALLNNSLEIIHSDFKEKTEGIITKAIRLMFNRDLEFKLEYRENRGGIETKILILEDGQELSPKDDLGGSIIDIISFVFKIVLWHVSSPQTRNIFILDEPFKFAGRLVLFAGKILKDLSKELNLQIIMITHETELIDIADKVFKIHHKNGQSYVETFRRRRVVK